MSFFRGEFIPNNDPTQDELYPIKTKTISSGPFGATPPTHVFIASTSYELIGVREVHSTASSSGTLQVEKLTGTTAPGSGSSMLSATINTAATANTVVSGALVTDISVLRLAAGDRVALVSGGSQTNLAGAIVILTFKKL
jgi:hypothetical protein